MRRLLSLVLLSALALAAAPARPKPKLVVIVVIDQFRYDYLTRFRASYTGGLARMLDTGAVFTNAHYEHFPTVTAIGHSTILTGATPSISGIVGNEWYDRESGKQVTSVSDATTEMLGGGQPGQRGSSPRRLLVSTVADQLRMVDARSKAIGISSKDRSAILPTGRMSNGAYWFDTNTGNFVSSTYYFKQLPDWAVKFNQSRVVDQWLGKAWNSSEKGAATQKPFLLLPGTADRTYYSQLDRSPFHNDLLVMFAEAAVEAEQLGADEVTDVLTVSFSANDRVGHAMGPDAPEVRDISIRSDQSLARLFDYLDKKVGAANYVTVLTADHGVAPLPEVMRERNMPGGRMPEGVIHTTIQNALTAKYGPGEWLSGRSGPAPYLNWNFIREKKLDLEEVQNTAAAAIREFPFVYRVYTRTELRRGAGIGDLIDRRVKNGFHYERASDLFVVAAPYWLFERSGTSHGTPHNYDTHVPVVFMGAGIKAGRYHAHAAVNDIAPTLATILDVELPTGASGRVLTEMLEQQ